MFELEIASPIQEIKSDLLEQKDIRLFVKREDQIDPIISGNKFRKLKYNFIKAQEEGRDTLLTFGGAYSNHIHALAYAGKKYGLKTIGVIRGERIEPLNPTLQDAEDFGMQFHFVSRQDYKRREEPEFIEFLRDRLGDFLLVPEGGSNALAVKGCEEIIDEVDEEYDYYASCCGTGGTLAGIISGLDGKGKVLGFPVLKGGEFLHEIIEQLIHSRKGKTYQSWKLITEYHFGGYAKYNYGLIHFINGFKKEHHIQLDPVYTGKLFYGLFDLIEKDYFDGGIKILAIHTGGLQGIRGFNERFGELIK